MVNQTMHFTSSHKSFIFFPKKLKKNLSYKNDAQCNIIVWLKNSVNWWRASATCLVCRVSGETWTSKARQNGCHPTLICKQQKRIILLVLISVITNILLCYVFFFLIYLQWKMKWWIWKCGQNVKTLPILQPSNTALTFSTQF